MSTRRVRKHPKRRILVKHLLQYGQVWFIRRYGYITWQHIALGLNPRKDIRLGWALTDRHYDYIVKMQMLFGQICMHDAMGDTFIAKAMRKQLMDANDEYTKYCFNRHNWIKKKLIEYDRFRRYGWR